MPELITPHVSRVAGGGIPDAVRAFPNIDTAIERRRMAAASGYGFRGAGPLPLNVEVFIEDVVQSVGVERLAFVNMLRSRGLVRPMPDWLAHPTITQNMRSKSGDVRRTMELDADRLNYRGDYKQATWPVPAVVGEFQISTRELASARGAGYNIETDEIEQVTRRGQEAVEDQAFLGWVDSGNNLVKVAGNTQPGLLNATNANSLQFVGDAAGRSWSDAAKTGAGILADVEAAIGVLQGDYHFGPYALVVGTAFSNVLDGDYNQYRDLLIRERLLKINSVAEIITADRYPANKASLVDLNKDTLDVVVGEDFRPVTDAGDFGWNFKAAVVGCMFVRVKTDYDGNSGVVNLHT